MIVADNFAITEMPKTGSTFIYEHLGLVQNDQRHIRQATNLPVFSFYRDPVSWYTSYVSFIRYGSDKYPAPPSLIAEALDKMGELTIQNFIDSCLGLRPDVKEAISMIPDVIDKPTFGTVTKEWANTNQDFYSFLCDYYLDGTTVLCYNNLTAHLSDICFKYNYTPIVGTGAWVNVTNKKITLSEDTKTLIERTCYDAIARYDPQQHK